MHLTRAILRTISYSDLISAEVIARPTSYSATRTQTTSAPSNSYVSPPIHWLRPNNTYHLLIDSIEISKELWREDGRSR